VLTYAQNDDVTRFLNTTPHLEGEGEKGEDVPRVSSEEDNESIWRRRRTTTTTPEEKGSRLRKRRGIYELRRLYQTATT
jgi:hypothetical protein